MSNKVPTALKVLRGNPGKRPLPENEPVIEVAIPISPRHLSKDEKKQFRALAKQLAACKLITKLDAEALAAYCVAWSRWVKANDELKTCEWISYTENGYPMASPWLGISNNAFNQMKAILVEFGMTPAARTKVQALPDSGGSKIDPWSKV